MIYIKAEVLASTDAEDAIIEAITLANRMNVPVEIDVGGVTVYAKPLDDPAILTGAWHEESMGDHENKFATTP